VLPSIYQEFIHISRYARWREDLGRRETWDETVDRYIDFFKAHADKISDGRVTPANKIWKQLRKAILELEVMPSMRCLMTAGPALERDHTAAYNCAFMTMDHPNKFAEMMHILMCGTGVGFSVERQYVSELPAVADEFYTTDTVLNVRDSRTGWGRSFKELVTLLYAGQVPTWDTSKVRPEGAPLKTFGGRASGPEPLEDLFRFTVDLFRAAAGRKLNSLEVHDLCCKIADIVVVGGVRRSALLSLSNLSDTRMRDAKRGEFFHQHPERTLANNSVCYTEKPDMGIFMQEWLALHDSKSGERGIFNLSGLDVPERRDRDQIAGTNPCSEILLRDRQFCNLSEVVLRPNDKHGDIARKVKLATVLGTLQATLTNFKFLGAKWAQNCEEERLLGVSLTGLMDLPVLPEVRTLKAEVTRTNRKWAKLLGIEPATALTCVKPSGTVSQLVDSSSGIHPRYAPYYVRRVRNDIKDPVTKVLQDAGVPWEVDVVNPKAVVFSFPMRSPEDSMYRDEMTALEQLENWRYIDQHWCEHKASITVYVKDHEWLDVGAWVYKNFDSVSGVSFLPHSDHIYRQAPYEEITESQYLELQAAMPANLEWNLDESQDQTTATHELACTGGVCEL
jgi:ribonucleoside-diphosphate reductase alpha chain